MGKYSKKGSRRGSRRERMLYEENIDSGLAGAQSRRALRSGGDTSRVAREARDAQISSTHLSAASVLDEAPATLLAERDRRRKRTKRRIAMVLGAVAALFLGLLAAGAIYYFSLQNRMSVRRADIPEALLNTPTPQPGEPFNLVIFGSDARNPDQNGLTDTIIVARIDPEEREIWMVSIPRDTRVELPGHGVHKINAAYVFGGTNLAIQAVEDVSGQEIDHFITVNFWGFEEIVDSMGGVKIDVPQAINDRRADFTPDGSASVIAPGPQILNGAHALTFVRHRGYADGDIGRTHAQQLFFRALLEQITDVPVTQMPGIANSLADNVRTSFTPIELMQVGRSMSGVRSESFFTTTLPGEWRSPFIWIDEAEAAVIWERFGVSSFEPSEEEEGEEEESSLVPSDINMTVRNGTTRVGIGREAAAIMRARGFIVDDIGNTDNQAVYDENMVVYRDNRQAAELVAQFMPEATRVVQSRGMFRFDSEVLVILGSEWDITQVPVADVSSE